MRGSVISYFEMCRIEGSSLQRGMNFRLRGGHSVILMSLHPNAPYQDSIEEDGTVLIYEGHDEARSEKTGNPKSIDQTEFLPSGKLSENGKFTGPRTNTFLAKNRRISFAYMKKLKRASGRITAIST